MTVQKKLLHIFLLGLFAITMPLTALAQEQTSQEPHPSFTTEPAYPNTLVPYKIIAEVKPGETYEDAVLLQNNMDYEMELFNDGADAFTNEKGETEYTTDGAAERLFHNWTSIEEKTVLAPGEAKIVRFSVKIPEETEFKTYKGGITTKLVGEQKGNFITSYRIVTPIEITVTDEPKEIPKRKTLQTNAFQPTPYLWVSLVIFVASGAYYLSANRKEKSKNKNKA